MHDLNPALGNEAPTGVVWRWLLTTFTGLLLGFALMGLLFWILSSQIDTQLVAGSLEESLFDHLRNLLLGAALGVGVAALQSLVLRRYRPDLATGSFIFLSALGFAVAWWGLMTAFAELDLTLELVPSDAIMFLVTGLGLGLISGILQWISMRRLLPGSSSWIALSAIGWGVGLGAAALFVFTAIQLGWMNVFALEGGSDTAAQVQVILMILASLLLLALIYGLTTGVALQRMLRASFRAPIAAD